MLFSPEFVSLPFDWNLLLYGAGLAGVAGLASVFTHGYQEEVDLDAVKNRVAELENLSSRTLEQNDELAALYAAWATVLYDTEGALDEIADLFGKAEAVLVAVLAQGDDDKTRQQLGTVYLTLGGAYNDYGDLGLAENSYQKAVETLKPLDEAGNAEAKADVAGIKLNLGIIYRELGEFERAKTCLDESFLEYRAVEKITDDDTRFHMATVSVQQGNLLYEMGESVDTVVDAYNRAMRLYVEVIEDQQQTTLERELANVLLDRSLVTYENWVSQKFDSEEERKKNIDNVLLDISRGIELLEKQFNEGNAPARYDLFHAIALHGKVLCDAENFPEAKKSLDRVIDEFADLGEEDDLMQMAMAYATRAIVHFGLGEKKLSEQDCQKGSEMVSQLLQADSDDEEIQELRQQFQMLFEQLG